jgi:guanine deaminase
LIESSGKSVVKAIRGRVVHFTDNPATAGLSSLAYFEDGLLLINESGHISACGDYAALKNQIQDSTVIDDHTGSFIMPGFIDGHIHYAQTDVIASFGTELLTWLEKYTFPAEAAFADPAHAKAVADFFCDNLLRNGTTTASVFATVHPQSCEAIFHAAYQRNMRLIAGKVLMDQHCPENLRDTAASGHTQTLKLIQDWHGKGRLAYAITPRFVPTSSREQLALAGELFQSTPGIYLQSHVAENKDEIAWVARLYPNSRSYLSVYREFRQLGPRAIFAHCLWLDQEDWALLGESGTSIAFCPTSNTFLGSGLFDLDSAQARNIPIALATDVGGGTSFSMLQTMAEAYKVARLKGQLLAPEQAFYMATLGGAKALHLQEKIGNFQAGKEADLVVIDPHASPLLERRMRRTGSIQEALFALMMLGDDRCISATYLQGKRHSADMTLA